MKMISEHRVTPEHLSRKAIVYVRQSSPDQVRNYTESKRVQIGLREKAIELGWKRPTVVEEDLGLSAGGYTERPGFKNMLAQVAMRLVGIILCIDASRLSRNSKDWANLFELCGYFETLIADQEQVYDLSLPNDRLVLGIKGTVSELELSILRTRLKMGAESKASRGELKFTVPPGYTHDNQGMIIIDPDRRVQKAIEVFFDQFDRCSSVRQLGLWYRETKTLFPIRKLARPCTTSWEVPSVDTLRKLLKHPIYAGVYAYGRSRQRIECIEGRLVKKTEVNIPSDKWRVCIFNHHPEYISWDRYLANQAKISSSKPRWTMEDNLGPLRDGLALISGLLRCGHCGKKVHVAYKSNPCTAMYYCDGKITKEGGKRCLSFGSQLVDKSIGNEVCIALSPHAIEAACLAKQRRNKEHLQAVEQARLSVEAAQYEADRAYEQYDLVDPKNRLVADTLEEKLNQKLSELQARRHHLEEIKIVEVPLTQAQNQQLIELSKDFTKLWSHPKADPVLKKKILRAAIFEIIVKHQPEYQQLEFTIHWHGGVHTKLYVKKRSTPVGNKTDPALVEMIRDLAGLSDADVARILNMKQVTTPRGLRWTKDRVLSFRKIHRIKTEPPTYNNEKYLTGKQVMQYLNLSRNGVLGLLRIGALHNHQKIDFAPWKILRTEVESEEVKNLVQDLKKHGRLPRKGGCPKEQLSLSLED